jgi:DNA polymerase III epsilon subunit-like protein
LGTAAAHYGVSVEDAHNALVDAKTMLEVLRRMALDEDRDDE